MSTDFLAGYFAGLGCSNGCQSTSSETVQPQKGLRMMRHQFIPTRHGNMIVKPNGRDILVENAHHSNSFLVERADVEDLVAALQRACLEDIQE